MLVSGLAQGESGTEVRIFKVNSREAVQAKLDQASEESLIVTTKTGQISIPKDEIDRIDSRTDAARRLMKQTQAGRKVEARGAELTRNTIPGGTTTVKTDLNLPAKAGFTMIYSRQPKPTSVADERK